MLADGFPRVLFFPCGVLFPPLWCFPPRCAGAVPPCGLSTPHVALLSWNHLAGLRLRASPRQTWAGSSLAAAGAPQLHASALQQRRRLAHRPAHVNIHNIYIYIQQACSCSCGLCSYVPLLVACACPRSLPSHFFLFLFLSRLPPCLPLA